jgi:hypothetical protein
MPAGFESYNKDGSVAMSITSKYTKVLGTFVAYGPGSLFNSWLSTGVPFAATGILGDPGYFGVGVEVVFSGSTMYWNWPQYGSKMATVITYGVN